MRWGTTWVTALFLLNVAGPMLCAKDHQKKNVVHKPEQKKETVPRFTIPHPNHPESAFIPEAIGLTVGAQRGTIVGTELPGAYGEDYDMDSMSESGSGISSGSGSGAREIKDPESPETPGKNGNSLVHQPPPSNPSTAFVGNQEEEKEEKEGKEEKEEKEEQEETKEDVDLGKELDADEAKEEEKKDEDPSPLPEATTKAAESPKKEAPAEKVKAPKKAEKHHSKAEKSSKVVKKKSKAKSKDHEENNMISKIDAIAKQIERVEHREKLDRKEAATLKVAKKVAKKVIKNINAKKKHKKSHKVGSIKVAAHKSFDEFAEEEDKTAAHKKETAAVKETPKGPEGFECPWACFWTCHSYCPKECCNNPFKCDLGCREFCTPYCTDRCCAPGSQRLPKLQINFNGPLDDGAKNITAIFAEDDKHQLPSNTSAPAAPPAAAPSPHEKEEEDAKLHTKLDPAENSYQQMKEQEHQIALANQIEALKKATSYAAQLMGLPPECPLACARICLPGLCKQQCCARSALPPIVPPAAFQANPLAAANFAPAPQVTPSRTQLANLALARKQQYLMAHGMFGANPAAAAAAAAYHNKLALQNRLLEGKNDFVPALARYRAMQYANQLNRQKMMLNKNLESQASRQQIADQRCQPGYPGCPVAPQSSPSWLHNCPPICRSSCIPQCPNECCAHSSGPPAPGAASM